jgi:hypothetical protein
MLDFVVAKKSKCFLWRWKKRLTICYDNGADSVIAAQRDGGS